MNIDRHDFCGGIAHVINLPARTDRLKKFQKRFDALGTDWKLDVHPAMDGKILPHPDYWISGNGAWGCYRSHLRIIEQAINEGRDGVLIFEDDAFFSDVKMLGESWTDYLQECLRELPDDWGFFYLGGQHQRQSEQPVVQYSPHLHYAYSVNRTHGYAVSQSALPIVYKHLLSRTWQPRHHIDHHLEVLHRSHEVPVFSASTWLVSQDAGKSDIRAGNKEEPLRTWQVEAKKMTTHRISPTTTTQFYTVGYGEVGTNGNLGYEQKQVSVAEATGDWHWVSAHATSRLTIQATQPTEIVGAVNDTGRPRGPIEYRVDGHSVGTLTNAGEVTETQKIPAGIHVLEIQAADNRQGHTVWGLR